MFNMSSKVVDKINPMIGPYRTPNLMLVRNVHSPTEMSHIHCAEQLKGSPVLSSKKVINSSALRAEKTCKN